MTDTTLLKGIRLLEALSASRVPRGVSELARELDLTRSNTFRLLGTLMAAGYAQKDPATGRYVPTLRGWEFGAKVVSQYVPRRVAQPFLHALHAATHENVFLSMLDLPDILYIDKVEAAGSTRISAQPGDRLPAFLVASGQILIAHDDEALAQLPTVLVHHPRGATLCVDRLRQDLLLARDRGWAISRDGSRPGVTSIAAAVWEMGSKPMIALAVSGPSAVMPEARVPEIATLVTRSAVKLSEALGFRG